MDIKETGKILAILTAYYPLKSVDPKQMVTAWHIHLKYYNYPLVERAVINFSANDRREYSQFPSAGMIIGSIEREIRKYYIIADKARKGDEYKTLSAEEKEICSEIVYNRYKELPCEERLDKTKVFVEYMQGKKKPELIE